MSKKQQAVKAGKRYRANTDINTDPHTYPGDEFDPLLVSAEALQIFIELGHVVEESDAAAGENNG
mgnify:CR=1 FL=1